MTLIGTSTVWRASISVTVFFTAFQTCIKGTFSEYQDFTREEGPMDDESSSGEDDVFSGSEPSSGSSIIFSMENVGFNLVTETSITSEVAPLGENSSYTTAKIDLSRVDTRSSGNHQDATESTLSNNWPTPPGVSLEEQGFFNLEDANIHFVTENGGTSETASLDETSSYKTTQIDVHRVDTQSSENLHLTTVASIKSHNSPAPLESGCCECAMDSVHESNLIAIIAAEFAIFDEFLKN